MGEQNQKRRIILHVDMNCFYASVECAFDPSLQGKPLAIAGDVEDRRGIVVTCSYEAREFGIKPPMPLWEAKRLCRHLLVKKPDFQKYKAMSARMFQLLREYTDLVEPVSIDEGYMELTYVKADPLFIAYDIQRRLKDELGLPSSIGVAPNKFLAKMASDMKKPMGITILRKRDIPKILWPLEVGEMHGIGKKTEHKLNEYDIFTIGDLAKEDSYAMKQRFGVNGVKMWERANGIDERKVDPDSANDYQSIGHSTTLKEDTVSQTMLSAVFSRLAESVERRLRQKQVVSSAIQIVIRYANRHTITRSKKLENPIQEKEKIYENAWQLFKKHWNGEPIRLLGVTALDLVERDSAYIQLDLFHYHEEKRREDLTKALDAIRKKYGDKAIQKGNNKKCKE
ncbi:DNA polymerase IV [Fictibacillus gelatini]|uniref:DNA polymerase IV n=1 Tax=Fictibacillus gelatini TaxID=225985 RepID=UPI000416864D|nr:DNA polymerase IV [Fictibacillus gelatini]